MCATRTMIRSGSRTRGMAEAAVSQPGIEILLSAARFCRTPVPAHIRRVLRQMPPTAVRLPCLFRTAAALSQRLLARPPAGKGLLRFWLLRKVVCRRRSLPPLSSLRTGNQILRKLRLKRPSETSLSPDTQSPPSRRFQTAKQRETRRSMVKSVGFSVSSVIHF